MNGARSIFMRKGYWLTALAAIVLLAASPWDGVGAGQSRGRTRARGRRRHVYRERSRDLSSPRHQQVANREGDPAALILPLPRAR